MAWRTRARMETPGGLGAHSSASIVGMHYLRASRRERRGADDEGGGLSGMAALARASVLSPDNTGIGIYRKWGTLGSFMTVSLHMFQSRVRRIKGYPNQYNGDAVCRCQFDGAAGVRVGSGSKQAPPAISEESHEPWG